MKHRVLELRWDVSLFCFCCPFNGRLWWSSNNSGRLNSSSVLDSQCNQNYELEQRQLRFLRYVALIKITPWTWARNLPWQTWHSVTRFSSIIFFHWSLFYRGMSTYLLNLPLPLNFSTILQQLDNKFWCRFVLLFQVHSN